MLTKRMQLLRLAPVTRAPPPVRWQAKFLTRSMLAATTTTVSPTCGNKRDLHTAIKSDTCWSRKNSSLGLRLHSPALAALSMSPAILPTGRRFASNEIADIPVESTKELVELPDIPTPPPVPIASNVDAIAHAIEMGGEPTFASIGLGGWSPVGLVQNCMEYLHVGLDIPWWGAIAIGTLVVRTIIFPLVIVAQRNSAKMNNNMPQMQLLQMKMTEARQSGNAIESARYAQEMMIFMREKGVNPFKNMVVPLAQAPLFISFFMGLRQMANTPVESMRDGGLFWFTDLTIADPMFLLPLITSVTLYLTIEIGTDSARLSAANMNMMKYVLRALPLVIFPFTMNFPAGILTYWACSNFISLGQVAVLRIPAVREFFKIEKMITHQPSALPQKKKGFVGGMKDSWQNMKITKEIEERQRMDQLRFDKAGKGPLVKTYKQDPTRSPALQSAPGATSRNLTTSKKSDDT